MLRITQYADRLIEDLDGLDWPEPIKKQQRDWIGRSEGAHVRFAVVDRPAREIEVFTTRPDTLFGATYMVLAPEHPLVATLTTDAARAAVTAYVERAARKSERSRQAELGEKTGVAIGAFARNPANGREIPIWIADYVLAGYGTGAIMAVPGHDERDWAFAKTFGLPIVEVVAGGDVALRGVDGERARDGFGLPRRPRDRRGEAQDDRVARGAGHRARDGDLQAPRLALQPPALLGRALSGRPLSRRDGRRPGRADPGIGASAAAPRARGFQAEGRGLRGAARAREGMDRDDRRRRVARCLRDANTMPQWAGSCWYFLRFMDPHNDKAPWSAEAERYWGPVDLYVGGAEHAVLHLLYSRFWHKVFFDLGLVHTKEPFQKLVNQGMILGESFRYYDDDVSDSAAPEKRRRYASSEVRETDDGPVAKVDGRALKARWLHHAAIATDANDNPVHPEDRSLVLERVVEKMSKSKGNVVNPDDVIREHGADSMRLYEMFIGPLEKAAPWSTEGILGIYRFLQRGWRLFHDESESGDLFRVPAAGAGTVEQRRLTAQTIAGVSDDIEAMRFNTAISKLMVFARDITKDAPLPRASAEIFLLLLAPLAPHLAEEIWQRLGHAESLAYAPWPVADPALLVSEEITLVVQVNGKKRGELAGSGRRVGCGRAGRRAGARGRAADSRGAGAQESDRREGATRQHRRLKGCGGADSIPIGVQIAEGVG